MVGEKRICGGHHCSFDLVWLLNVQSAGGAAPHDDPRPKGGFGFKPLLAASTQGYSEALQKLVDGHLVGLELLYAIHYALQEHVSEAFFGIARASRKLLQLLLELEIGAVDDGEGDVFFALEVE